MLNDSAINVRENNSRDDVAFSESLSEKQIKFQFNGRYYMLDKKIRKVYRISYNYEWTNYETVCDNLNDARQGFERFDNNAIKKVNQKIDKYWKDKGL